jgi:hypothetical protein
MNRATRRFGPVTEVSFQLIILLDKIKLTAVRGCHPDTGDERNDARDEDGSSTAKVLVQRCIGPTADDTRAEVRSTVE